MAIDVSSGSEVGRVLREARESRGVELDRAAQETRIHRRFLEALEKDAPPEQFPAPMYAGAFLREYARYLGLEPDPLVDSYRSHYRFPEQSIRPPMPIERTGRRWAGSALALASVIVLVVLSVFAGGDERPLPRVAAPPAPTSSPPELPPAPPPRPRAVVLRLRVVERPSWVQVTRGGRVILEGTLQPGFSRALRHPRRLDLVVGDAGAVRVTLNGRRVGALGGDGQVFAGSARLRDGKVRLRASGSR